MYIRLKRVFSAFLIVAISLSAICVPVLAADSQETDIVASVIRDKSILFLGDSYTAGRGISDYADTWCARLELDYGMEVTCNSINGSTLAATPYWGYLPGCCYFPISLRPIPEGHFDVIFVSCGSNDWNLEIPIGTDLESRDVSCFMGAINVIIDRVQYEHPESTLILMTPWISDGRTTSRGETTDDYAWAMEQICFAREVACLNASFPWVSEMFADHQGFREQYFLTETDPWHLNAAGHERFLPLAAVWIAKGLLISDIREKGGTPEEIAQVEMLIPSPWIQRILFPIEPNE